MESRPDGWYCLSMTPSMQEAFHQRLLVWSCAFVTGLLVAFALLRPFHSYFGHDQAWGIYMADQWLHGVQIDGPELYEVNPPYLVWFMSLPLLLGRALHLSAANGTALFFDLVFLCCLVWSVALVRRRFREDSVLPWLLAMGITFGGMCSMTREDIGERDQFAALMVLPYLLYGLYRLRRERVSTAEQVGLGILAAAGACLKPQYIVLPLLLEAGMLLARRLRFLSVASIAFAASMVAYAASNVLFGRAYFQNVVPLIRSLYYATDIDWMLIVTKGRRQLLPALVILLLSAVLSRRIGRYRPLVLLLCGACAGAIFLYFYQHKGFGYHRAPMLLYGFSALAALISALLSMKLLPSKAASPARHGQELLFAGAAAMAGLLVFPHVMGGPAWQDFDAYKTGAGRVFAQYPEGTPVQVISTLPFQFPAVVEQHKVNGSRFMHLWWFDAAFALEKRYRATPPAPAEQARFQAIKTELQHDMADDLQRWKPPVVLVDQKWYLPRQEETMPPSFFLDWMLQDDRFRGEWSHYHKTEENSSFVVYVRGS